MKKLIKDIVNEKQKENEINDLDLLISAHYYLSSDNKDENLWNNKAESIDVYPLIDKEQNITCWYIKIESAYAIVNNNILNMEAIEFGNESNKLVESILEKDKHAKIVYDGPGLIYERNSDYIQNGINGEVGLYESYPELLEDNNVLMNELRRNKELILSSIQKSESSVGDWGIGDGGSLPSGSYTSKKISKCTQIEWSNTSDVPNASNNCGPTAITNLALYFAANGYPKLYKGSVKATAKAVHNLTGDGAHITIADDAKKYFKSCGYTLDSYTQGGYDRVKTATKKNHPCGILLTRGVAEAHWVISIGYREYTSGAQYVRIITGWKTTSKNDSNYYYKSGTRGTLWVSTTEYFM